MNLIAAWDFAWLSWGDILLGAVITVATFVISIAAVAVVLVQLPATYFLKNRPEATWGERHPVLRWVLLIFKNLLGVVLVAVGVVFLFTPGQGVLTILIGVMLLDFPGKRTLERKLIARPGVLKSINRLRARFGKAPLVVEEEGEK
jgi:hypothetical protein